MKKNQIHKKNWNQEKKGMLVVIHDENKLTPKKSKKNHLRLSPRRGKSWIPHGDAPFAEWSSRLPPSWWDWAGWTNGGTWGRVPPLPWDATGPMIEKQTKKLSKFSKKTEKLYESRKKEEIFHLGDVLGHGVVGEEFPRLIGIVDTGVGKERRFQVLLVDLQALIGLLGLGGLSRRHSAAGGVVQRHAQINWKFKTTQFHKGRVRCDRSGNSRGKSSKSDFFHSDAIKRTIFANEAVEEEEESPESSYRGSPQRCAPWRKSSHRRPDRQWPYQQPLAATCEEKSPSETVDKKTIPISKKCSK